MIVIATAAVTIISFKREHLFEQLLLSVDAVLRRREWWRVLSSSLVHADYPHLLANLFTLFAFGAALEQLMGTTRFFVLYVGGVVVASMFAVVWYRRAADYRAVGASGGVCAVIGAATALYPDSSIMVFPLPFSIPGWIFAAAFVAYSIVGAREQWDNVGHAAHLGGTVFGIVLMFVLFPDVTQSNALYVGAVLLAGGAAVAWLRIKPRWR